METTSSVDEDKLVFAESSVSSRPVRQSRIFYEEMSTSTQSVRVGNPPPKRVRAKASLNPAAVRALTTSCLATDSFIPIFMCCRAALMERTVAYHRISEFLTRPHYRLPTDLVDALHNVELLRALTLAKTSDLDGSIDDTGVGCRFLQTIRNKRADVSVHINDSVIEIRKEIQSRREGVRVFGPGGISNPRLARDWKQRCVLSAASAGTL